MLLSKAKDQADFGTSQFEAFHKPYDDRRLIMFIGDGNAQIASIGSADLLR